MNETLKPTNLYTTNQKKIYEKEYKENKKQGKQKTYSNKYFYNILQQLIEENPQLKEIEKTILIDAYRRLLLSINKYKKGLIAKPKLMEENQSYISYKYPIIIKINTMIKGYT